MFRAMGQQQPVYKSLNGIIDTVAKKMINNYETYIKSNKLILKQQNVWFDKTTFKSMTDYIDSINTANVNQPQKPKIDGVRMYLGMSGNASSKFVFQVIMVATVYDGYCDTCPSKGYHKDIYFDASASLFQSKRIQGRTMFRRKIFGQGERLYTPDTDTSDDVVCPNTEPHYITRKQAETWVANDTSKVGMITNSEWFEIGLLDTLANDTKHDGIRIYLAKHGPNDTDKYQKNIKNKDICIFETTESSWFTHRDYFDCNTTAGYFNKYLNKLKNSNSPYDKILAEGGGTNSGGQDNGELCPDNCEQ